MSERENSQSSRFDRGERILLEGVVRPHLRRINLELGGDPVVIDRIMTFKYISIPSDESQVRKILSITRETTIPVITGRIDELRTREFYPFSDEVMRRGRGRFEDVNVGFGEDRPIIFLGPYYKLRFIDRDDDFIEFILVSKRYAEIESISSSNNTQGYLRSQYRARQFRRFRG